MNNIKSTLILKVAKCLTIDTNIIGINIVFRYNFLCLNFEVLILSEKAAVI